MASSLSAAQIIRVYGNMPSGDPQAQGLVTETNQANTETLAIGTARRMVHGPKIGGHFSLHVLIDSAAGATSAMTVWYSNLPFPSLANDNDWIQDTTIGTIDLTSTSKFFNVGNVDAEWVMIKAVVANSTGNVRVFARVEGTTHGKTG